MKKLLISILIIGISMNVLAQPAPGSRMRVEIWNDSLGAMHSVSVVLMKIDSTIVLSGATDKEGVLEFNEISAGEYILKTSHTGYRTQFLSPLKMGGAPFYLWKIRLVQDERSLTGVVVIARRPAVQFLPDKTVVNVEASITSAGGTVMDVLEKSPGITIGRDGAIMMKGKPSVMVLIDGKQTQMSGTDLQAYLQGLPASQISTIELIDNPGARYDASGNAGIINIKTKTTRQKGFNGSASVSYGQGFYPKNNNSINLNLRSGKFNWFINYGNRFAKERMEIEALRKYFDINGNDSLLLNQPGITSTDMTSHNLKTGLDFFAGKNTTLGIVFTGNLNNRTVSSFSSIDWMTPSHVIDSSIVTSGTRHIRFKRKGVNFYGKHTIDATSEISADLDIISFNIAGDQYFQTQLTTPGSPVEVTKGNIPSTLDIVTAKVDYTKRFKSITWEAGLKTATTKTDNLAEYSFFDGGSWQDDLSRSNHFLYDESIHSAYSSLDKQKGKWHWQAGLRYELTSYKAHQLGNAIVKDSSFKRNYGSLFPSAFVSYEVDSNNTLTFRIGRRIDRPPFQQLNPFLVTLNKYTFEGGNPFIRPQYTWNFELTHNYKNMLSTGISYSYLKDYFSQIFIIDSNSSNVNKNIIIYTRGNVGTFHNIGLTATLQLPLTKWWSITSTMVYNHKIIKGVVWKPIKATINQLNISLNNQFQFKKGWAAEISGFYLTKSQTDLQEYVTPQGEVGAGISKQIMKTKGTLRLAIRDIFHTQNYSGYSNFENSDEPFALKWDTRIVRLSFSFRFGKAMKTIKRSSGGATDETDRVGTGN